MVRSCLLSLQSKPLRPAGQASQTCWASLSGLLGKPPMLVEQVSWNVMGKSGPSSYRGPTWKDGLYLLWACGYGLIGLANGPIGPTRPYLTFYPLQLVIEDPCLNCLLWQFSPCGTAKTSAGWFCWTKLVFPWTNYLILQKATKLVLVLWSAILKGKF